MDVQISPSRVEGTIRAPPSKSYTHRAILAAGYTGEGIIQNPLLSADTEATIRATERFGGDVTEKNSELLVETPEEWPVVPEDIIDCANSGTTIRLAIGTAALVDGTTVFTGDDSLRSRPQGPLLDALTELGATRAMSTQENGKAPVVISGTIEGGNILLSGDLPSHYTTSLLMAGPQMKNGVAIEHESEPNEIPYIDLTIDLLDSFGVQVQDTADGYTVSEKQTYERNEPYTIPGDFSSMSYLLAAGAVAGDITITGAYPNPQGDKKIIEILSRMGAKISWNQDSGEISVANRPLTGVEVDVTDTPDLLPTIAVLGAIADGTTEIVNCRHVRQKETDRVELMAEILSKMGATVSETPNSMTIYGGQSELDGATVKGYADHRIIMALSVAALSADRPTTILGAEHVDVSYPDFFTHLAKLGVDLDELDISNN